MYKLKELFLILVVLMTYFKIGKLTFDLLNIYRIMKCQTKVNWIY